MNNLDEAINLINSFFENNSIEVELLKSNENTYLYFDFPRESEEVEYSEIDVLFLASEIETLELTTKYGRTKHLVQYPIFSNDNLDTILDKINLYFENNNLIIRIVKNPILIGFSNVKLGFYSKYFPPISSYFAIEIKYKTETLIDVEFEQNILKSFIFEFHQASNIFIEITELYDSDNYYYEEEAQVLQKNIRITELLEFNHSIDFYLKAADTIDSEIKYLYYYKIIEYFSPKVAKLKTYEILTKKLDLIKYQNIDNTDLNKIIEIADSFKKSKTDSEICKTVLSSSIDIIDLFDFLPDSCKKTICKNIKLNPNLINYDLNQESIDSIFQQLGKILYSTRNKIVHAKSNYISDGFECKFDDIPQLNIFLLKATSQILKWNDKLPKYSK